MRGTPFGVAIQRFLGTRVVPTVAIAPLRRNLIHIVVNALVPVPEDRPVRTDFVKSSPNWPRPIDGLQAPSVGAALVCLAVDRRFAKPCHGRMNRLDHPRTWLRQPHQKQDQSSAFTAALRGRLVVTARHGL